MRNRLFVIVSSIAMAGILLAGWFLGVGPQLSAAADDDTQRATVDAQNEALRGVVARLIEDEKDLPKWKAQLSGLQRSIPRGADTSAFIDDINAIAVAAGVVVSSISISDAEAYVAPVSATPVPAVAPAGDEAAAAASEVVVDPLVPSALTNSLVTGDNFVLVPVTVQSKGAYDQILNFVSGMQTGNRLYLVTSFASSTSPGDGITTGTTTGYIYVLLNQFDPTAAK